MFDAVRKNKRVAQVIVVLIALPFAFFGMEAYFRDSPAQEELARVGGEKISLAEFENALRDQQNQLRSSGETNSEVLNSAELRQAVLDNLINQRVLAEFANQNRLAVPDQRVREAILGIQAFHDENGFSLQRYEALLRSQGMNQEMFEVSMRRDLAFQQLISAVGDAGFGAQASVRQLLSAQLEEREVRTLIFDAQDMSAGLQVTDEEIAAHYEAHAERYQRPERVRAEYVVMDSASLVAGIEITAQEIEERYHGQADRYRQAAQRRASHILLLLDADAPEDEVAAVRARGESLLSELRASPDRFAELASANSEDPGSAGQGGDLGYFGRGAMVPAFEEVAFTLAAGEISDLVRTDFGYHILQVADVQEEQLRPLEDVREEILAEIREERSRRLFAEAAEEFANMVYEEIEGFQGVSERFGVTAQESNWLTRTTPVIASYPAERVIEALFSPDSLDRKQNINALEVQPGVMISARVKEFEAATRLPLEEVEGRIRGELLAERAAARAAEEGEAILTRLRAGESLPEGKEWEASRAVRRNDPQLGQMASEVFSAQGDALPVFVGGADFFGNYHVIAVDSIRPVELGDQDERLNAALLQYDQIIGETDLGALLSLLRQRYEVQVRTRLLLSEQE